MNTLLVRYSGKSPIRLSECVETLGLGYLASVLRKHGFNTAITDGSLRDLTPEELCEDIMRQPYDLIGFTIDDPTKIDTTFEVIKMLRSNGVQAHLTMGGHTPTFAYKEILSECPELDSIIRFEGEETLVELVEQLDRKKDWREIRGIAYKANDNITSTPHRPLLNDLDSIPFPARDILLSLNGPQRASISSSRGCYGSCIFCSVSHFYRVPSGKRWRARSAENVIGEIDLLVNGLGISEIEFVDDNFIGSTGYGKSRALEIAESIKGLGKKIMLALYCRSDEVELRIFEELYRTGLREVLVGAESGSDADLRRLGKKTTVSQNKKALETLMCLGIDVTPGFIMFNPYITLEEILENIQFLKGTGLNYLRVSLNVLQPYSGTSVSERLRKENNLRGGYKEFSFGFNDRRIEIVLDIIKAMREEIFELWLRIRELQRTINRREFWRPGSLQSNERDTIKRTIKTIISEYADIYESVVKFAFKDVDLSQIDDFKKSIGEEIKKYYNTSSKKINILEYLLRDCSAEVRQC